MKIINIIFLRIRCEKQSAALGTDVLLFDYRLLLDNIVMGNTLFCSQIIIGC